MEVQNSKFIDFEENLGMDVAELSPKYDTSGISTALTCKTLR